MSQDDAARRILENERLRQCFDELEDEARGNPPDRPLDYATRRVEDGFRACLWALREAMHPMAEGEAIELLPRPR